VEFVQLLDIGANLGHESFLHDLGARVLSRHKKSEAGNECRPRSGLLYRESFR
jgi:hypothetical protein